MQAWDDRGEVTPWSAPARFRTALGGLDGGLDRARPGRRAGRRGPLRGDPRPRRGAARPEAVPAPAARLRRRRPRPARDALRHRARARRAASQRRARGRRRPRPGLDGLPAAHRVRRPRRHRSAARRARTSSARSSATGGTRATSASTPSTAARTTAPRRSCCASCTSSAPTAARSVVALGRGLARDDRPRSSTPTCCMGERYDARADLGPWTEPGYDDAAWSPVAATPRDDVAARARARPADPRDGGSAARRDHRARAGRARRRPRPEHGRLGPARASRARRGTEVRLRFAEMLEPDGSLHLANLRGARPVDSVRAARRRGRDVRAALHVPRLPLRRGHRPRRPADLAAITGRVVHSDTPRRRHVRELERARQPACSATSRGASAATSSRSPPTARSATSASAGSPTPRSSCRPRRLNMDVAAFMTKWGDDVLDAQSPGRRVPRRRPAPAPGRPRRRARLGRRRRDRAVDAVARATATARLLERHWDAMERYMAHLAAPQPGPAVDRAGATTTTATGCRSARDTPKDVLATALLGVGRQAHGRDGRARSHRPERAAHYDRLRDGHRGGVHPRLRRRRRAASPATRRRSTCSRCTWT